MVRWEIILRTFVFKKAILGHFRFASELFEFSLDALLAYEYGIGLGKMSFWVYDNAFLKITYLRYVFL